MYSPHMPHLALMVSAPLGSDPSPLLGIPVHVRPQPVERHHLEEVDRHSGSQPAADGDAVLPGDEHVTQVVAEGDAAEEGNQHQQVGGVLEELAQVGEPELVALGGGEGGEFGDGIQGPLDSHRCSFDHCGDQNVSAMIEASTLVSDAKMYAAPGAWQGGYYLVWWLLALDT